MKDFNNKVAVITGAASGIGRALAARCVAEGMAVVLADIEEAALRETERALAQNGGRVAAFVTDVSKADQVAQLARRALERFGAVHLLFNNAGVAAGMSLWGSPLEDWEWVVNVNLWGVIHGMRTFVPIMLEQKEECHIVNTSSVAGLTSAAFNGIYGMSKHAVVCMSETLYKELGVFGKHIGVSVLCPGFVRTRLMDSSRNRPVALQVEPRPLSKEAEAGRQWVRDQVENGMPPNDVADQVFAAMREGRFYVVTHPDMRPLIRRRAEDVIAERNPQY
ncbi:MAG TPA: SDR family NAD(P)-dependent oxidoreductase [Burkholderiaceae bacterium]